MPQAPNAPTIRPATPADIPALLVLDRSCPSAAHWTEAQYHDLFAGSQSLNRLVLLVESHIPHQSPNILGFLVARHLAPEWELENIVVAASARRKGIGARLLDALLSQTKATDSAAVFLEVRESNTAARALYAKAGFEETGRRKSYYANPPEDAILYRLVVRPAIP